MGTYNCKQEFNNNDGFIIKKIMINTQMLITYFVR